MQSQSGQIAFPLRPSHSTDRTETLQAVVKGPKGSGRVASLDIVIRIQYCPNELCVLLDIPIRKHVVIPSSPSRNVKRTDEDSYRHVKYVCIHNVG